MTRKKWLGKEIGAVLGAKAPHLW
jgi:hypothetical protein